MRRVLETHSMIVAAAVAVAALALHAVPGALANSYFHCPKDGLAACTAEAKNKIEKSLFNPKNICSGAPGVCPSNEVYCAYPKFSPPSTQCSWSILSYYDQALGDISIGSGGDRSDTIECLSLCDVNPDVPVPQGCGASCSYNSTVNYCHLVPDPTCVPQLPPSQPPPPQQKTTGAPPSATNTDPLPVPPQDTPAASSAPKGTVGVVGVSTTTGKPPSSQTTGNGSKGQGTSTTTSKPSNSGTGSLKVNNRNVSYAFLLAFILAMFI